MTLYYFEQRYPSKAIVEHGDPTTVFSVIDSFVDKTVAAETQIEFDDDPYEQSLLRALPELESVESRLYLISADSR